MNGRLKSRSALGEHLPLQGLAQCLDSWKLEFVDWSSGRLLNLGDAVNMKQGLKDLKLVDLFFKVMAQPPGILLTSPHPQQLELELHGPESPLVGSSLLALRLTAASPPASR